MPVPENLSRELKNLSAALTRLELRLGSETTPDPLALVEFRQTLDNVRLRAWSVSELINAERARDEPDKVLAFLSAERLRLLDQLVRNLCGDIERRVINSSSYGMHSLFDSVNVLQQKLAHCIEQDQEQQAQNNKVSNAR